jgi:hypothetical protein
MARCPGGWVRFNRLALISANRRRSVLAPRRWSLCAVTGSGRGGEANYQTRTARGVEDAGASQDTVLVQLVNVRAGMRAGAGRWDASSRLAGGQLVGGQGRAWSRSRDGAATRRTHRTAVRLETPTWRTSLLPTRSARRESARS